MSFEQLNQDMDVNYKGAVSIELRMGNPTINPIIPVLLNFAPFVGLKYDKEKEQILMCPKTEKIEDYKKAGKESLWSIPTGQYHLIKKTKDGLLFGKEVIFHDYKELL